MEKSRCLGLIGGLGVGATVHYYEKLAKACEKLGLQLDIVITNAQTPNVFEYVEAGNRDGLADYLNGYIQRMKAAGAEIAAVPAVTPHYCAKELAAISPVPLVSIFEPLLHELAARSARRVAIFGTRYVIATELFGSLKNVEVIRPKPEEVDLIHNAYVELAATGKGSAEKHKQLTVLAKTLVRRDGVDAMILAGTDLTLQFNESNTDFPHIDCAALHIAAILHRLAASAPERELIPKGP
jgi:aspartate racemase